MRMIALPLLLFLAGTPCRAGLEDYAVAVKSPRDSATLTIKDKKLAVKITSATGIGRIELGVKKEGADWPELLVLSIQTTDGKPLKELEGFTLSGGKIRVQGSRRTSGAMDCRVGGANTPEAPNPGLRKVRVLVEQTATAMTVTIPGALLKGESKVAIQWIDFYR